MSSNSVLKFHINNNNNNNRNKNNNKYRLSKAQQGNSSCPLGIRTVFTFKFLFKLLWCLSLLSFPITVTLITFIEQQQQQQQQKNNNNAAHHGALPFHHNMMLVSSPNNNNSHSNMMMSKEQEKQKRQQQRKKRREQQQQQQQNNKQRQQNKIKVPVNKNDSKFKGRHERLIDILSSDPKTNISSLLMDDKYIPWNDMPTWEQITSLYGKQPVIHGLDTCKEFRDSIPNKCDRLIAPAGLYNTGTNLLAQLLENNCYFSNCHRSIKATGMEWQVPWGKHTPPEFRLSNTIQDGRYLPIKKQNVLPVVMIREPYEWFRSTCSNNYVLRWPHRRRCPNLILKNGTYVQVMNQYYHGSIKRYHTSLAHFYNDWNIQYMNYTITSSTTSDPHNNNNIPIATFPRLMIRHKDLVFFPKESTEIICKCAGGTIRSDDENNKDKKQSTSSSFKYVLEAAKNNRPGHRPYDGLVGNWLKYGKKFDCTKLNKDDIKLAKSILNTTLLKLFHYDTLSC